MVLVKTLNGCSFAILVGLSYAVPSRFEVSPTPPSFLSDIPPFLSQNLSKIEVRDGIRAFNGKSITQGLGENLAHLCTIEIVQSHIFEKGDLDNPTSIFYQPHDILFEVQTICSDPSYLIMTRQCTISMLEESGSWELVRLRGKPEGCPSGRDLLELHEQIGRQIGARSSTLIDGSEYELYRGNEDMVLRVRSTLFNVLFKSDSTELESFYSKFGYTYPIGEFQKKLIEQSILLIQSLTLDELKLMLDLGTRVAREMEHILFDYIQQGVKTARELARRLIKSEKLEDKLKLMHFIEQIFIFSQPTPIRQAILTITTIRPMIKQL